MRLFKTLAALTALAILLAACAAEKPIGRMNAALYEDTRAALGTVGVASPCLPPDVGYRLPAKGGWAGAGRGAGVAAEGTVQASLGAAQSGGYGGVVGAAILVTTPLTALIGTFVGAASAEPTEKVESAEVTIQEFILYNDAAASFTDYFLTESRRLAESPVAELPAPAEIPAEESTLYANLAGTGIDTVAEANITGIGLEGPWGVNPELRLVVTGNVRLVRVADGVQLFQRPLEYRGPEYEFCVWAADNACLLRQELDNATRELAECAAEETFLLNEDTEYDDNAVEYRPVHWLPYSGTGYEWFYGLKPVYPELGDEVPSLKPVFRWEAFPRARDKAFAGRVDKVTYDLRVWEAVDYNHTGELVYSKEGITGTSHEAQTPLTPSKDYVWSVRARYLLDGKARSTLWGMQYYPNTQYGALPRKYYYQFSTPSR